MRPEPGFWERGEEARHVAASPHSPRALKFIKRKGVRQRSHLYRLLPWQERQSGHETKEGEKATRGGEGRGKEDKVLVEMARKRKSWQK